MASQFRHLDVTLTAAASNLAALLTTAQLQILRDAAQVTRLQGEGRTTAQIAEGYSAKGISMQAHPSNANPIYVGGAGQVVSASSWGWFIPTPSGGVPSPPLFYPGFGGCVIRLNDFTVFGDAGAILHLILQDF